MSIARKGVTERRLSIPAKRLAFCFLNSWLLGFWPLGLPRPTYSPIKRPTVRWIEQVNIRALSRFRQRDAQDGGGLL
jgi:hypothetical protein